MSTSATIWLIGLGLIFAVWAMMMFRMLWIISRNAAKMESHGFLEQTNNRSQAFGRFFRDPEYQVFRRNLLILSVTMMALNLFRALTAPV